MGFGRGFESMKYKGFLKDFQAITMIHLHCGTAGTNGDVVADLLTDGVFEGVLESKDMKDIECEGIQVNTIASLYQAIRNGSIYMNIHSEEYPAGVARGQIFV